MNHNVLIQQITPLIEQMLVQIGCRVEQFQISPLQGGNNRVYKIVASTKPYILKHYFSFGEHQRNRFESEYLFNRYASECGFKQVPRLISSDRENNLALFEYVDGRKLKKEEIGKNHVSQAIEFIEALNLEKNRESKESKALPMASDACFNARQYVESVDRRMKAFQNMTADDDLSKEARMLVCSEVSAAWKAVVASMQGFCEQDQKVRKNVSPSDFGFHNAIIKSDGTLYFIDFEYAGWDDPVKLVCDFFCQPQLPVPMKYFDYFVAGIKERLSLNDNFEKKVSFFMPLHKIKWVCIMLNVFLADEKKRKQFVHHHDDNRKIQLDKAIRYIHENHIC